MGGQSAATAAGSISASAKIQPGGWQRRNRHDLGQRKRVSAAKACPGDFGLVLRAGMVQKWRIVTAPAEIRHQGAQSGAAKILGSPRPSTGRTTAESMSNSSRPATQAKIPADRNTLFHIADSPPMAGTYALDRPL